MKAWPRIFYLMYAVIILATIVLFQPGWGFMDDAQNLKASHHFWSGQESFSGMIRNDIDEYGRFRPLYKLWIAIAYKQFPPVLLYVLIALMGLGFLLVWGRIITQIFPAYAQDQFTICVYPLIFFAFTPFWNLFMYISIQEKFIYFFGAVAFCMLIKAYQEQSLRTALVSMAFVIIAMMGKETALALMASFFGFAMVDLFWARKAPKISLWVAIVSATLLCGYTFFIRTILGGYTADYKSKMNINAMLHALFSAPFIVKTILVLAGVAILVYFVGNKNSRLGGVRPYFLIAPFFLFAYILILLPWSFANYLLAPLGVFVGVVGYLFFAAASSVSPRVAKGLQFLIVFIVGAVLTCVIIPRISKMADKRKIVETITHLKQEKPRATFFYPPPMEETVFALRNFSSADIVYTPQIDRDMLRGCEGACYGLINDEAHEMQLESVEVSKQLYTSGTWAVYQLQERSGYFGTIQPKVAVTLKNYFKKL